ncbi:MAG: Cof-type HAD-IIB family hydrolase [Bacilli bacterium]|nr:Cof-type HAD-IIB family hydrolase [Bacilli bacterium]
MKSNYLFVIDLDGTLLPSTKEIPFFTKRYLSKINQQGCKVVLASGRPAHNIRKFYDQLRLDTPIIALNGLHINHPDDDSIDSRVYFPPKKIKEIVNLVSKHFEVNNIINETDKYIYITNNKAYLDPKFWLTNMKVVYGTLEENLKNPVMTFLMELKNRDFDQKKLKELFIGTGCDVRCWIDDYQGYIEIYEEHSNKARAIKIVADEMKISMEQVFAFGDDLNDIEMLRDIANAYAMKNAPEHIKKIAHHLTKYDNEHEGVKKEIKRIRKKLK